MTKSLVPIIPAKNECYKLDKSLCELRQFADSKFECSKNPETCCWREEQKDLDKGT